VLSSAHAGGAELIRNGVNGWVVAEVSGPSVAEGLERLRSADPTALTLQARASAEPYTHAAQAERFETLYRNPAFH